MEEENTVAKKTGLSRPLFGVVSLYRTSSKETGLNARGSGPYVCAISYVGGACRVCRSSYGRHVFRRTQCAFVFPVGSPKSHRVTPAYDTGTRDKTRSAGTGFKR